jgi:hypothetical protein
LGCILNGTLCRSSINTFLRVVTRYELSDRKFSCMKVWIHARKPKIVYLEYLRRISNSFVPTLLYNNPEVKGTVGRLLLGRRDRFKYL